MTSVCNILWLVAVYVASTIQLVIAKVAKVGKVAIASMLQSLRQRFVS